MEIEILTCLTNESPKRYILIYISSKFFKILQDSWPNLSNLSTGVCVQWDSNRAPGVRGGAAAAGGPAREYMPVADKIRSGKTRPAEGSWFLINKPATIVIIHATTYKTNNNYGQLRPFVSALSSSQIEPVHQSLIPRRILRLYY